MLLGEILEHVPNPVSFLSGIHKKYQGTINKIVITVPNAFGYRNEKPYKDNIEIINSDHFYWFSPYTLTRVMFIAGFKVEQLLFADSEITFISRVWHKLTGKYLNIRNKYGMTLIGIGRF